MTKVVLDAFGGDHSPEEIVKGAVMALEKYDVMLSSQWYQMKNPL